MATPLWLCLHLPDLGLEVFTRGLPAETQACPRVLTEPCQPGSTKLVVALANSAAATGGIQCGTSLATARSICPELKHFQRQPPLETMRLAELAEHLHGWSHQVSLAPADALVLEVGHSLRLFGPLPTLCAELLTSLARLGHQAVPGLGHTPEAAIVLARQAQPLPATPPTPNTVIQALRAVPLTRAGFTQQQVSNFRGMGLHHLGQVLDLPLKPLGRRFGKDLLIRLQVLTGSRPDPRPVIKPRPRFHSSLHLFADLTDTDALLFPMQRLLGELELWLTQRQLRTRVIHWWLDHPGHPRQQLVLATAQPTMAQKVLLNLTRLRLDRGDLQPEVASITLRVPAKALAAMDSNTSTEQDLFQQGHRSGTDPDSLLDLFRARLGDTVCSRIELQDDHRPEHAFRLAPAQAFPRRSRHHNQQRRPPAQLPKTSGPHPPQPGSARPLWLLKTPQLIREHTLELLHGPERIDVGWWQTPTPRDYFVARQMRSGQARLCWVFHCPDNGGWFLHGLFS